MRVRMLLLICFCSIPLTSQAAAIHDAAKKGDIAAIAAALDAGANVNDFDVFATPLYYAVNRQHLDAAKLLIERGDMQRRGLFADQPSAGRIENGGLARRKDRVFRNPAGAAILAAAQHGFGIDDVALESGPALGMIAARDQARCQ